MVEGVVENATAMKQQNLVARCYEKLSAIYKAFHFRRSPNNQGVSSTEDALLRMAAESGGGEDLADLITDQYFSWLFTDGDIIGDTVLHYAARCGDSNAIDTILNHGQFSGSKNFKEALCRKRNAFGNTALHEVVMIGHVEGVRLLYAADKVVAHYPNKECKSPLYLAIEYRNKQIVDILFPSASSFLYERIWGRQELSTSAATEESDEIIRRLKTIEERKEKKLKAEEMQRHGQPSNSHLKLQLENYKAKEILARPEFYKAIKEQDVFNFASTLKHKCNQEKLYISDIVHEVNPRGDTLLHMAASFGRQEMVEFIAFHFPQLVTRRNIRGDTTLHVVATTRSLHNMIIILTCYAKHSEKGFYTDDSETLCRIRNECGNTALHESVMINHVEGASLLLSADRVVAHYLNVEDKSPLYMAIENDSKKLVHVLLHAPFDNVESHRGNSPLHAAILKRRSGGLLKKLLDKRPELIQLRDQKGGNPLHCAALIGYLEGVRTLLEARPLSALERNKKGYLPIHVASKSGRVKVVKEIVEQEWLDPLAMLNLKGQNILHIAAKNGKHTVVSYILKEKKLEKLLNEKDKNGSTPLHLASKNFFPMVLLLLTLDKRVKVNLINNQCMSSGDIVLLKRGEGSHRTRTIRMLMSSSILHSAGTPLSEKVWHLFRNTHQEHIEPWLKEYIKTVLVVAILVATVTFAAGFTMPGGFNASDDSDPKKSGMATLVNRRMFQVFTICDAVAMYSSTFASFILLWTQVGDFNLAVVAQFCALFLVFIALLTMSIAFTAALHLVVGSLFWLAWAVIFIGTIALSIFLFALILFVFPLGCRVPILRHISHFLCLILIPLSGSYLKLPKKKKKTKEPEQQWQKDETRHVRIDMPETQ